MHKKPPVQCQDGGLQFILTNRKKIGKKAMMISVSADMVEEKKKKKKKLGVSLRVRDDIKNK